MGLWNFKEPVIQQLALVIQLNPVPKSHKLPCPAPCFPKSVHSGQAGCLLFKETWKEDCNAKLAVNELVLSVRKMNF